MTAKEREANAVGIFEEKLMNGNGEKLMELCDSYDLRLKNWFYRHKDIHKYTKIQETRNQE